MSLKRIKKWRVIFIEMNTCISYLLAHNTLSHTYTKWYKNKRYKNKHLLSHSSCSSGTQEQISCVVLARVSCEVAIKVSIGGMWCDLGA